jgi:hypothetical protein
MAKKIEVQIAAGVNATVKQPYYKIDASTWVPAKTVYTKTATGWEEVWPGARYYIHDAGKTSYNMNIFECFGSPTEVSNYIFINNGTIGGSQGVPALRTGVFPAGSTLTIINNFKIAGAGGRGGWYNANRTFTLPTVGSLGLLIECPVKLLDNTNGTIAGGGGGGGGSAEYGGNNDNNAPGGGGAGIPAGQPGATTWYPGYTYGVYAATETTGGYSSFNGVGRGGDRGQVGQSGRPVGSTLNLYHNGALGGAAIQGFSYVVDSINHYNGLGAVT